MPTPGAPPPPQIPPGATPEQVAAIMAEWQKASQAWGAANKGSFWDQFIVGDKDALQGTALGSMVKQGGAIADATLGGAGGKIDPGIGKVDTTNSDEIRKQQMDLIHALQGQMAGSGPSLAQAQLGMATDANMKGAMSMGAAQQGQGLGHQAALRSIGDQRAAIQQQAAGQSSMQRMMEQMQAQQQLAGLLGGTRGQDIGVGSDQAHLGLAKEGMQEGLDQQGRTNLLSTLGGLGSGAVSLASSGMLGGGRPAGGAPMNYGQPFNNYAAGGAVDSPANDTVPAMLSPGEIVLPLSVTEADDPAKKAAAFVEAIKAQKRARGPQ